MKYPYLNNINLPIYAQNELFISLHQTGKLTAFIADSFTPEQLNHLMKVYDEIDPNVLTPYKESYLLDRSEVIIGYFYKRCFIAKNFYDNGFTPEFLDSNIHDYTIGCYAVGMYICLPKPTYLVFSKDGLTEDPELLPLEVPDHFTTVLDLFRNVHYYSRIDRKYVYLSDEEAMDNLLRYRKQNRIFNDVGNDGMRIADHSRLFYFIINELFDYLSDEGKLKLAPLLEHTPGNESITSIVNREVKIQGILKDAESIDSNS